MSAKLYRIHWLEMTPVHDCAISGQLGFHAWMSGEWQVVWIKGPDSVCLKRDKAKSIADAKFAAMQWAEHHQKHLLG